MDYSPEEQRLIDAEHLRLLRLGYFVSGGFTAFMGLFGLLYAFMGLFIGTMMKHLPPPSAAGHSPPRPPASFGWVFVGVGLAIVVVCGTVAALKLRVARCLRLRSSHTFGLSIAVLSCLGIPYGTALGVFSFVVLTRPSVRELFGVQP